MNAKFKTIDTGLIARILKRFFHICRQEPDFYPVRYYKKGKYVKVDINDE